MGISILDLGLRIYSREQNKAALKTGTDIVDIYNIMRYLYILIELIYIY